MNVPRLTPLPLVPHAYSSEVETAEHARRSQLEPRAVLGEQPEHAPQPDGEALAS